MRGPSEKRSRCFLKSIVSLSKVGARAPLFEIEKKKVINFDLASSKNTKKKKVKKKRNKLDY